MTTAASLALGTLVGALSSHDRQAVQLSLLILLASVFFSGFVLAVDEFRPVAQAFAWLLPVTHGIALLQDLMLGGLTAAGAHVAALVGLVVAYGLLGWLVFRRAVLRA
ncbi:MAG: ABC transporter permease [Chloroflexi bacterium]|nr:ABC transporter permease [Chloroflexota bacterium]